MNAVLQFINESDINVNIIEALIEEIARYIKKMKTLATWIGGLSATFIVLFVTLVSNYFIKIFDVYSKVLPTEELLNEVEILNQSIDMNNRIFRYLDAGLGLLGIFIIVILLIYNFGAMFTFIK